MLPVASRTRCVSSRKLTQCDKLHYAHLVHDATVNALFDLGRCHATPVCESESECNFERNRYVNMRFRTSCTTIRYGFQKLYEAERASDVVAHGPLCQKYNPEDFLSFEHFRILKLEKCCISRARQCSYHPAVKPRNYIIGVIDYKRQFNQLALILGTVCTR